MTTRTADFQAAKQNYEIAQYNYRTHRINATMLKIAKEDYDRARARRSEEHTSELQSHSFISYAVFCLKKKNINYYKNK